MSLIGVYVPTLGRPGVLQRVFDNVTAATRASHNVVFVVEPDDPASHEAATAVVGARLLVNPYEKSYSNALQHAYEQGDERFFIAANDDFDFQPGWDVPALALLEATGAQVVGLNDGNPCTDYSTIALVRRSYIREHSGVIGMPDRVQYPYQHNYVDTEFYCTAVSRGVFRACPESRVLHIHPDFGHGKPDRTYQLGRASFSQDAETFQSRAHLWSTA